MGQHNEVQFESELCEHLAANGWLYSPDDAGYDRQRALFPDDVIGWLEATQPDELAKIVKPSTSPQAVRRLDRQRGAAGRRPLARDVGSQGREEVGGQVGQGEPGVQVDGVHHHLTRPHPGGLGGRDAASLCGDDLVGPGVRGEPGEPGLECCGGAVEPGHELGGRALRTGRDSPRRSPRSSARRAWRRASSRTSRSSWRRRRRW
jgi:hypothetical protein